MSEEQTLFISTLAEASTFFVFADFFSMLLESISGLYHLPGERANKQCVIFSADAIATAMRRCVFLAGSPRKTRPWPVVPADLPSILLARIIHDGSWRNRAVALRDGHAEPRGPESYLNSTSRG